MKQLILSLMMALFMVISPVWAGEAVNINTATAQDLQKIDGVGAKIADRIVTFRNEHGAFKNIEDLLQVKGIGEKTLENNQGELTTGEASE
ncbi:MAG: helix-hairpin-helix domain-containing protein [Mariprofundus sp.]